MEEVKPKQDRGRKLPQVSRFKRRPGAPYVAGQGNLAWHLLERI
jgi:hypothetical protein